MKKLLTVLLAAAMLFSVTVFAFAASADFGSGRDPWLERVVDNADLLDNDEEQRLSDKISKVMNKYGFDILFLTVDSANGYSAQSYAENYWDTNDYGCGDTFDGVIFLLVMDTREWWFGTDGLGSQIFTKKIRNAMVDKIIADLTAGNYYRAFSDLTSDIEDHLYQNSLHPIQNRFMSPTQVRAFIIMTIIGIIIALIVTLVMKGKMKTNAVAVQANNYVRQNSLQFYNKNEVFQYSNVVKVPVATSSSSSGRTGGSSGGHSHSGSGGHF